MTRRDSACTGKKEFLSRRDAKRFNRRFRRAKPEKIVAYKCDFCPGYHLGHLWPGNLLRVASYNAFYNPE